jgi:signal transduction histidine kinase
MADAPVMPGLRRWLGGLFAGAVLIAVASGLVTLLEPFVPQLAGLPPVYLLAVLPVAVRWGAGPGVAVAALSIATFAFLFVPPRGSFAIADARYGITLGFFLLIGVAVAWLAARSRREERESARLSQEQAGLRRVATLVAGAAQPREVFAAVSDEIARLLEPDLTTLVRFEPDGTATFLAGGGWRGRGMQIGRTMPVPASLVPLRDGAVVRIDDLRQRPDMTETVEKQGLLGVVGCPIVVEGRVWGSFGVGSRAGAFPSSTEQRLVDFTELIGAAIANAESRAEITRLLDEQAALRRVATLVARGVAPEDVFASVSDEIGRVLDADVALMLRLDPDGGTTVVAETGHRPDEMPVGSRWELDPQLAMAQALRTGRSARRDEYRGVPGEFADVVRRMQIRSSIAIPIVVEGRIWGALGVGTRRERLPADSEGRMAGFADLVGTAIANAESRAQVTRLLDVQAALHRVATLVASEAAPDEVVPAVTGEIRLVLDSDATLVARVDSDGQCTIIAQHGPHPPELRVGKRWTPDPGLALAETIRTGRPAFRENYSRLGRTGEELIRTMGVQHTIALPIIVDGRVWGAVGIARTRDERFPPDVAQRVMGFAELLSTAVRNTENRSQTRRLLEEQAALRRVATLVATGPSPAEVSRVVAEEVRGLLGVNDAGVCRYEPDGTAVLLVGLGDNLGRWRPGMRWAPDDGASSSEVWRTGRSARFDSDRWEHAPGPVADQLRRHGVRSVAASPVIVDGRLWGAVMAWSSGASLPADTEPRMARFTELVAMAIGNAESRAELAASRARIVAASDETRRRIERDLHDGAQQRLVSLGLELRLAQTGVPEELPEVRAGIGRVADDLGDVLDELREMARGIHPAMLSEGGLRPALRTLARRVPVPVELNITTDARFPEPVEVAAYYVVSEALTNAVKHAKASHVTVSLVAGDGVLQLTVRDDGVGGADPQRGSGLIGLRDRVEALGGRIEVESPRGAGTIVLVTLPVDAGSAPLSASRGT